VRRGVSSIVLGAILLAAGAGVTLYSEVLYWYGAIIVGVIEIIHGVVIVARSRT
jgi:hypothetical protein